MVTISEMLIESKPWFVSNHTEKEALKLK